MKILVGVKRAIDYNVRVRVRADGNGVADDGVKMSINPFDEIALEQALRIKEAGQASEVIIVSVGPGAAQQQLRTGLAMGADRAILVETDAEVPALSVAQALHRLAEKESVGLVLLGKQSIDTDNGQTGPMLAALWDRPQATFASAIDIDRETARVTREVDAGLEKVDIDLPAVITVDLRLNEPRYVKLPDIMKAKKKPLEQISITDLQVATGSTLRVTQYAPPGARSAGFRVDDVSGLLDALKQRGLV